MQRRLKLTGLSALLAVGIWSAPLFAAGTGSAPASGSTTTVCPFGSGMMSGGMTIMRLVSWLGLLVLVLAAAALIKYLFTKR